MLDTPASSDARRLAGRVPCRIVGGAIGWLNENSGAVQGVSTVVLLLLTAWYSWLTHRALSESNRPFVYIEITPQHGVALLRLGNTGTAAAERIRFAVRSDIQARENEVWSTEQPFAGGLDYLAPGGKLDYRMLFPRDLDVEVRGVHVLDVSYRYRSGRRQFDGRMSVDLAQFGGVLLRRESNESITRSLDNIARQLRNPSDTRTRLARTPCPFCHEQIATGATKCPHCLERIVTAEEPKEAPNEPPSATVRRPVTSVAARLAAKAVKLLSFKRAPYSSFAKRSSSSARMK